MGDRGPGQCLACPARFQPCSPWVACLLHQDWGGLPALGGHSGADGGGPRPVQHLSSTVVESISSVPRFAPPWTAARQASLSLTTSRSLLKLMSIESVMPSSHLILCHPILLLLSIFSSIRVFSNESALCIGWPKFWSFSISPSSEDSGLISSQSVFWQERGSEKYVLRDFPGGTVDKNPPASAGDTGLIPDPGKFHVLCNRRSRCNEKPPLAATRGSLCAAMKIQCNQKK